MPGDFPYTISQCVKYLLAKQKWDDISIKWSENVRYPIVMISLVISSILLFVFKSFSFQGSHPARGELVDFMKELMLLLSSTSQSFQPFPSPPGRDEEALIKQLSGLYLSHSSASLAGATYTQSPDNQDPYLKVCILTTPTYWTYEHLFSSIFM